MGLVRKAVVHTAEAADRNAARRVMGRASEEAVHPRMRLVWSDRGYNGALAGWMEEKLGWALEIVKPPRRWVRVPEGEEPPPYTRRGS